MNALLMAHEPSARYVEQFRPPLLQHFEALATESDGVVRLRELIVSLAVAGKLLPQKPTDEPAEMLIARARSAKSLLQAQGKIGRDKPTQAVDADEATFPLPRGWTWCRLGDLAWPQAGFAFKSSGFNESGNGLPLVRIRDVGSFSQPSTFFAGEYRDDFVVERGDWLISMDGEFRVRRWHAERALLNQRVTRLIFVAADISQNFVAMALQREMTALQGTKAYTTVDHLSAKQIAEAVVALPPKEEQARIIARVDELMGLCDALEAKGRLEAEQHTRLLDTLLGTLTDSTTAEELATNWQRVATHFDLLLDRPEAVDALEQTILRLAVRGLLVSQDPDDESAALLLKRLRVEKERHQASSGRRKGNGAAVAPEAATPFSVPDGWVWSALPDLCFIAGGSTPAKAIGSNWIGDIPWVSPKDMKVSEIHDAQDHVSPSALAGSLSLIPPGSLLMVVRGMILAHSFPVATTRVPLTVNQDMKALTPYEPKTLPYLLLVCQGMKQEILALVDRSTHGTCKLESPKIFGLPIPVPPLNEQARIVSRVTELRRLCTDLRQRLAAQQTVQSHLADALVESALA